MEIDDRVTVATPEGVDVEMVVVGLGSRFASALVDTTLEVLLIIPLLFAAALMPVGGGALVALGTLVVLVVLPALFDSLAGGRTPGRRLAGLRLVMLDGSGVGALPAAVRNVIRLIDILPGAYAVGTVAILASPHNQRLGDMAAGTIVVRDGSRATRSRALVAPGQGRRTEALAELPPESATWDLSGLTAHDVEVVRAFAARRATLDAAHRSRLASELAERLAPVVVGPRREGDDERFLLEILAVKDRRGR